MNEKVKELNLKNTNFKTPHGLDKEEHYTTAYELALITDYAMNIEKIKEVVETKTYNVNINGYNKTIKNTNELLGYLKGVDGVKTGFTNGAGRCLVTSVERDGFDIITVVLGADTKKIRTSDSIKLIEYVYSNYELVNLEQLINEEYNNWLYINKNRINIYKGKKESVKIKIDDYNYKKYPIKKEEIKNIKIEIENIKNNLEAPIYKNTQVAILNVSLEKNTLLSVNIVTDEEVEKKGVKEYVLECLKSVSKLNSL